MTWNGALSSDGFWQNVTPPIDGSAGISAAYSFIEHGPIAFREVVSGGGAFKQARIVRFAADGRMWLAGASGVLRTVQPVTFP